MNLSQVNSGKGVIVDSGTTDTYFHRSLKAPFEEAFKTLSGRDHSNRAIKLSHDELVQDVVGQARGDDRRTVPIENS